MKENNNSTLISTREHKIGKTTFIVSSFADSSSKKTAQELIMDMLISKVRSIGRYQYDQVQRKAFNHRG